MSSFIAAGALMLASAPAITFDVGRGEAPWPSVVAHFPGKVSARADIIYAQPLHYRPLRLDLYQPRPDGKRHPLIVHVHGGAWVTGTKRHGGPFKDFPAVLAQLAARGFVVASIEYRLDGEAKFPAAIQDVKTAIRFLRRNAGEFGIDPDRVGIFGGSAGGQLAALATTSCGVGALEPAGNGKDDGQTVSDCVQAGVSWYGVHDFGATPIPPGQTGPAPYLGCPAVQCPDETMKFASPVTYVDPKDPPMLLIHGLADKLVVVEQTRLFERALHSAGVPVRAIYIPGVDHGFVGRTDAETHAANLLALEATFAFFTERLLKR